jgi:hypothetical protein
MAKSKERKGGRASTATRFQTERTPRRMSVAISRSANGDAISGARKKRVDG